MTKPNSQQLPLRGVAMILIAVALLLVGWGLYSATQKDNSTDVVVAEETTNAQQAAPQATQPAAQNQAPATTEANPPAQQAAETPHQGQAQSDNSQVTVHVLNNSTVQGLAAKAKDSLMQQGYKVGHVGNHANSIVPENTVYYTDNEAEAQELAASIGGVAQKRPDNLPAETAGPNSLVVVLAGDF